jgi:hypothetical protein
MIIDGLLLFSSAQAITATAASTNVLDMVNARDMGAADPEIQVAIFVGTAFSTTNAGTLTIALQGSTDNSTFTTYAQSRAYTAADMPAGAKLLPIELPAKSTQDALPRYYRLNYTVANAFTAGTLTAMLVLDRQDRYDYPAGINITN